MAQPWLIIAACIAASNPFTILVMVGAIPCGRPFPIEGRTTNMSNYDAAGNLLVNVSVISAGNGLYVNAKDYGATGTGNTDDSASLQAALNAIAIAGKGALFLPAGTYSLSQDLVVPSNCMVLGAGRGSILKAAAGSLTNCLKLSGVSHCMIAGLAIDGNKANVQQVGIQYVSLSGIQLTNCDDITITRCFIHDCYVSGIMANGGCTNLMISNNRLVACFDNQIYIRAQNTTPYTPCSYATITGNICSGGSYSGIQVLGSSYVAITGNTCYGNGPTANQGDGIGSEGGSHITIAGNVCYNNGIQGIHVRYTSEVGANLGSSHVVVSGNECYNHTSANGDAGGIAVDDTDDIVVSGNLVYGNQFGINVNGGQGLGVSHCQIVGNSVRNNSNIGLRIAPGTGLEYVLQDNYVTDSGGDNVFSYAPVIIQGGVYARAAANKEGIHLLVGSNGSVIDGAVIYDNQDNGILIDSPVMGVEIRNCLFNNIAGTNQRRALQEQAGAGPTRMVNCRILNQSTNLYVFNNTSSRYYDEQTQATATVTANYTAISNDEVVLCNQAAAITVTLPSASGVNGRILTIKDKSGTAATNTITVSGANTIDGAASKIINTAYGVLRLVSDGSNWFSI